MKRIMPDTGEFLLLCIRRELPLADPVVAGKNNRIKMYKNTYIMNNTSKIRKIYISPLDRCAGLFHNRNHLKR